jgi:regulator of RNase E activity RraA
MFGYPVDVHLHVLEEQASKAAVPVGVEALAAADDRQVGRLRSRTTSGATVSRSATTARVRRGIVGTVIDGYCRDIDDIRDLGYPVWARGGFMRSGKNRVRMVASGVPVRLDACDETVTAHPGDLVCADGSGVVVVPRALVDDVTVEVQRIAAMEERVLADVAAGTPLRQARQRHGYHQVGRRVQTAVRP